MNYRMHESDDSGRRRGREEVDLIEIESEPVDRFNTRQNKKLVEEQMEPVEQGTESTLSKKSKKNRPCRMEAEDIPRRFPDEERVLLTGEGEPESFEQAKKHTHNMKWLSAM